MPRILYYIFVGSAFAIQTKTLLLQEAPSKAIFLQKSHVLFEKIGDFSWSFHSLISIGSMWIWHADLIMKEPEKIKNNINNSNLLLCTEKLVFTGICWLGAIFRANSKPSSTLIWSRKIRSKQNRRSPIQNWSVITSTKAAFIYSNRTKLTGHNRPVWILLINSLLRFELFHFCKSFPALSMS